MEIKKIEHSASKKEMYKLACEHPSVSRMSNCDYVMFPRLQRPGLKPKHVERDAFRAELKHVERHGDYWLLYQQAKPHLVAHVQLPKTETEFDHILGWCLGQNHWCDYITGDLSFICVIAGFNAAELTPKYSDFIKERIYALYDAVYWWYEYGKECPNPHCKSVRNISKKHKSHLSSPFSRAFSHIAFKNVKSVK